MDDIHFQFAAPNDATQIANLFSESFSQEVAQLLLYGCRGASKYIRMHLAASLLKSESAYFVAKTTDNAVIAAAELRMQAKGLLLNYIAVHPSHRGKNIGGRLLSTALHMTGVNSGQIGLDVLHDNLRALEWYGRLGFETTTSVEFLELAPPSKEVDPAYVSGLPQADLCQTQFGFSQFNLITSSGTFSVGRIGDAWFRLTDPIAVMNPAIFAALKLLDPERRIFAVVPAFTTPPAQVVRLLAKTHRMEAQILCVKALLSSDCKISRELV